VISYHRRPPPPRHLKREAAKYFTRGFDTVDTNDPERLARGLTSYVCAPGIFREGYRVQANFMFADWIGLDFDSGELSLASAVENVFCDMTHVIGITMSHQTEPEYRDKFRVMIPLERRVDDLALYRHQLAVAMEKWPCDEKCKDGARFFYPCREIVSVNLDGYSWEIDENVPKEPDWSARTAIRVKHRIISGWARTLLTTEWPPHTKNDSCFRLGCHLGTLGYSPAEIVDLILDGPTYAGGGAPQKEIFDAVKNGVERGLKDFQAKLKGAADA
jgi:hypothetical protein